MRVAIFSDIHGKLLLPFKLVDLYQRETAEKIDLILQCGDIGAFPDLKKLDKATLKHAKRDRDELGFHDDFTNEKKDIKDFLEKLDIPMICVRGNHEDHEFLDGLEAEHAGASRFPIDVYEKVWVCKTGWAQTFENDAGDSLRFVGIGRIGDRKNRPAPRFIQDYERAEIKRLIKADESFDFLISHDTSASSQRGYGMVEIRQTLDNLLFHYHFYGHTGAPYHLQLDDNGITQSCKIKELEFGRDGVLPLGCMVVLQRLDEAEFTLEVVSEKITNRFTKHGWRFVE